MKTDDLINELDRISQVLNGIGGRLIVASFGDGAVKEAHEMTITLGFEIDNLINELME
jgi:3-hydroxy-3-methylglutaryl CoA synthase